MGIKILKSLTVLHNLVAMDIPEEGGDGRVAEAAPEAGVNIIQLFPNILLCPGLRGEGSLGVLMFRGLFEWNELNY